MLSIIIVNYNSRNLLIFSLRSIEEKIGLTDYEAIIVNNDKQSLNNFSVDFPLKIVENGKNVGFGAACNIGALNSKGDVLLFLNPDTEILSPGIESLLKNFYSDPTIGIIGPEILTEKDRLQQWSFGEAPTIFGLLKNNLFPPKIESALVDFDTEWVSGAALFIRKSLFEKLNGFDENFFMYFEDIDLCKRARKKFFRTIVSPQAKIRHIGGKSFGDKKAQKNHYYTSQEKYFKKHHGSFSLLILKILRFFH